MKTHFTKEIRMEIIHAHIEEFGKFEATVFEEAAQSPQHPAHDWFTWDDGDAAKAWRVQEARMFGHIRITRQAVETVDAGTGGSVRIELGPMLVSPPDNRADGGGYLLASSPEGQDALRAEAALMMLQWLARFRTVLTPPQIAAAGRLAKGL